MSEKNAADENVEIAQRLQERFETYWLGLIFTLLALSVQTAKFGVAVPADALELASWVLLLGAGLAGLSRFEWLPELYRLYSIQRAKEDIARDVQRLMLQGTRTVYVAPLQREMPAEQYASEAQAAAQLVERRLEPIEAMQQRKYRFMKWTFVLAVACLIASRGYLPTAHIISLSLHAPQVHSPSVTVPPKK